MPVCDVEGIAALEVLDVRDVTELVGPVAAAHRDAVDSVPLVRDVVGISYLRVGFCAVRRLCGGPLRVGRLLCSLRVFGVLGVFGVLAALCILCVLRAGFRFGLGAAALGLGLRFGRLARGRFGAGFVV